jgi:hypothetical protein
MKQDNKEEDLDQKIKERIFKNKKDEDFDFDPEKLK